MGKFAFWTVKWSEIIVSIYMQQNYFEPLQYVSMISKSYIRDSVDVLQFNKGKNSAIHVVWPSPPSDVNSHVNFGKLMRMHAHSLCLWLPASWNALTDLEEWISAHINVSVCSEQAIFHFVLLDHVRGKSVYTPSKWAHSLLPHTDFSLGFACLCSLDVINHTKWGWGCSLLDSLSSKAFMVLHRRGDRSSFVENKNRLFLLTF